jgi:hypothetical protein
VAKYTKTIVTTTSTSALSRRMMLEWPLFPGGYALVGVGVRDARQGGFMKRKMTSALALSILTLTVSAFPHHAVASSTTAATPAPQYSITKYIDLSSPKFILLMLSALL